MFPKVSKRSKGCSTELMPSIMGAFDALCDNRINDSEPEISNPRSVPKKVSQVNNFALSANVAKILSNVPDEDINKNFTSEDSLFNKHRASKRFNNSLRRSPEKALHKSTENLGSLSQNLQKMLSNLPDSELVINTTANADKKPVNKNASFIHSTRKDCSNDLKISASEYVIYDEPVEKQTDNGTWEVSNSKSDSDLKSNANCHANVEIEYTPKPLGSYLHTSATGIASRTPVGRKNLGKYLQVPSESSVGTNSTASSSEVSRPVSLTSLGSCSSSGSSGMHQPGSTYLASVESLDSDPEPTGSQGSADSGIAEQPSMRPELCVLQEVLDTEDVYVADLHQVIQGYLEPWRSDPECPLQEYLQHLFTNLEEIHEFNRSFLDQLRKANCNPTLTANVFLQNDSGFSIYTEYCTLYPRTMSVLTELTRDVKMAALFRERQIALKHALPVGSYLLKPVQRILKYHLLLQRLSKFCDDKHKPAVDLALATMTGVATHINTMKRKHEHAVRVQEIQAQLYGWTGADLTALGELIAEGIFRVNGAKGRRHVFLFDKLLLMAKSKPGGGLNYKSHIMCSNLMLVEQIKGEPLSFHVLPFDNPRLQCTLRARSPEHKREWTLQLKRVIIENYSAVIPNHARQLVLQLGQDVPETEDTNNDRWSPLKLHSTPQYLERRSRARKSRDYSNRRAASQERSFPTLNWRRKSEPGMIPQYNIKTIPKKITKLKKTKDHRAKFYTDLSDSENCDVIAESTDSLNRTEEHLNEITEDTGEQNDHSAAVANTTIEQVVSDLLMQNEEFHKLLKRQKSRPSRDNESINIWSKSEEKLPAKADSLPRSFQLSDQIPENNEEKSEDNIQNVSNDSHDSCITNNIDDDHEHPEHKIYRKTAIRFSIVQKFRALLSEDHRNKLSSAYKQNSKSIGARIANPDYEDPHRLFTSTPSSSQSSLTIFNDDRKTNEDEDLIGEHEVLDMSLNESDVLTEFEKRLKETKECETNSVDTGQNLSQNVSKSSHYEKSASLSQRCDEGYKETCERSNSDIFSSQNSDSYYESILEKKLNGVNIARNGSFKSSTNDEDFKSSNNQTKNNFCNGKVSHPKLLKRPNKAPPPIPTKPKFLASTCTSVKKEYFSNSILRNSKSLEITNRISDSYEHIITTDNNSVALNATTLQQENSFDEEFNPNSKGWVKTIINRFE